MKNRATLLQQIDVMNAELDEMEMRQQRIRATLDAAAKILRQPPCAVDDIVTWGSGSYAYRVTHLFENGGFRFEDEAGLRDTFSSFPQTLQVLPRGTKLGPLHV